MHGNNDPNKKVPDSGRVKIDLSKIDPNKKVPDSGRVKIDLSKIDPNKKVPDSGRVKIDLSKIDPKKIDDFRDMIRSEEERKKNQSSGQGRSK